MRKTTEISESDLRGTLNVLMESQISILRSIKSNELVWINHFSIVMLGAIGYFATDLSKSMNLNLFYLLQVFILGFSIWFKYIMLKERGSYYRVYRTLVRIQNYLGLFGTLDNNGKPEKFVLGKFAIDAGFPKGYGLDKSKNGTKPYSSFLWRMMMILFIYAVFLLVSFNGRDQNLIIPFMLLFAAVAFTVIFFLVDQNSQLHDAKGEEGLLGAEDAWFK